MHRPPQAPLFEEFVFRSCMLPLLISGGTGRNTIIFASPLLFGIGESTHTGGGPVSGAKLITPLFADPVRTYILSLYIFHI